MKPEIKQKWLEALRSGKYKQGTGKLASFENRYCCLGVLCEIAREEIPIHKQKFSNDFTQDGFYSYNNATASLPVIVMEWSGMDTQFGKFLEDGNPKSLSHINDTECDGNFTAVIPFIEKYF